MKYLIFLPITLLSFGVALGAGVRLTQSDSLICTCDANGCYDCDTNNSNHKKDGCTCDANGCYGPKC